MKETIEALLDVYRAFKSIGYDPLPTFFSLAAWALIRERWVRPIADNKSLTRDAAISLRDKYKARSMWASAGIAALSSFAITQPRNIHEYIMWACWIIGHTGAAALLYGYLSSKKWMKAAGSYVAPAAAGKGGLDR